MIAQQLMLRLLDILARKTEFDSPFVVVARMNLTWVISTYWREKAGNKADAVDPAKLPAIEIEDHIQSFERQALEFVPWLDGLSERDRTLLCERIFLGHSPEAVAERLGIKTNAVNVAYFRALERARKSQLPPDVSDAAEGAA